MFKRNTVLINKDIYSMLKDLNSNVRHIIWDLVLEDLFEGKMPQLNNNGAYSDTIENAFILLRYELNKLQKQYDNGKKNAQKKSTQKNTQSLCPLEDSQSKPINTQNNPNNANINQVEPRTHTHAINNILYNKLNNTNNLINNKIYNNQIISNHNQSNIINNNIIYKYKDLCDFELTKDNEDRVKFYYEILTEKIQEVAELDPIITNQFLNLIEEVAQLKQPIKLQGYYTAPEVILEKYINIFRCEPTEIITRLIKIYDEVEIVSNKQKIKNKLKYLIVSFYNFSINL